MIYVSLLLILYLSFTYSCLFYLISPVHTILDLSASYQSVLGAVEFDTLYIGNALVNDIYEYEYSHSAGPS